MRLRTRILLGLLAVVVLAPSAGLWWLATTERGLAFLAARLGQFGSMTITATGASGTLTDGFRLGSLRVQHRLADVQAQAVEGRVRLLPLLLRRQVVVSQLDIRQLDVRLLRDDEDRPPQEPHFLPSTLRIDAAQVHLGGLGVTLLSGRRLDFTAVNASGTVLPAEIRIASAALDFAGMHLATSGGRVLAARPIGLEGVVDWSWQPEDRPAWRASARFDGDLDRLPLTIDVGAPFVAHITGAAANLTRGWQVAGDTSLRDLDLVKFGAGNTLGVLSGRLQATLDADGFTARGVVTPPGLKSGPLQLDFKGAWVDRHLLIRSASVLHAPSGSRATVQGTMEFVANGPRLMLDGTWAPLQWPLAAREPAFTSPSGRYRIEGTRPWQVQAEASVAAAGLAPMPGRARGVLGTESVTISEGSLQAYGGEASFTGEVRWKPAETWRVEGHMAGLDPAQLRADLPGRLGFDFRAEGGPFGGSSLDLTVARLAGRLRGQAAGGGGRVLLAAGSKDWQFRGLDLRLGNAHLALDGTLGETSNLNFALDADDLSLLRAEARGRFSARGRYAGTRERPVLLFKARGSEFAWDGYTVESLDADLDIDTGANGHARGQLGLTGLTHGARTLRQASLQLSGDGAQQRLTLDLDAAPLRTALSATGSMHEGLWQGSLESLSITDGAEVALKLVEPAALQLGATRFAVGRACVAGEQARVCGQGRLEPGGSWSTSFSASSLPLVALTAGFTQNVDYEGTINLQGELAGTRGTLPTGNVRGDLMGAQLRHVLANGREERLALGSGQVSGTATGSAFALKVELDAGASGSIRGSLDGERNAGDWRGYPIRGSLDARTDGLALLDVYVGGIDRATGQVSTRVDVSGTLGRPQLAGTLQLRNAEIDIYQVNLEMRELSLDARFDNTALDLSGQSRLGSGMAKFNGKLAWRGREPYGNLHVEGERLLVVDVPEARIEASPKLDFELAGRRIDATGEVRIPFARLTPADLTNAVLPSSDEVLVGAPTVDPSQRWIVVSDIRLELGEAVNIAALGLTARLGGGITVRTDAAQVSRGQGELNIAEGKYMAFGRLLDIERGRLIYNNVPLGDPAVDLRAQKVFPDVTAGINVRGSLRAPRLTFYSEPSIPQSQIASLILAGGSLESVQNSDRPGAARNDLLAQGGAILAQRVGSQVGIDDVGIESSMTNDTSLVLGKYLSPRLYISYGVSLAEAINTLKLRYTIGDRWTIKTEAGKARSADIVYTFKKK
jgi:translocation and assembly module TamB